MFITIHYLAQLKRLAGQGSERLELEEACTLAEALARVARLHGPDFAAVVTGQGGTPQPSLLVFVGGEQVRDLGGHQLKDGDEITLLTPMAGG
jgi:molybdopterin converting factor small subunit